MINQDENNRRVCPKSGWMIKRNKTTDNKTKVNKYFLYKLWIKFEEIIFAITRIKKGFNISIGWNLGKIPMSIHLMAPLISIPIKGTKNNNIKKIKKKYGI